MLLTLTGYPTNTLMRKAKLTPAKHWCQYTWDLSLFYPNEQNLLGRIQTRKICWFTCFGLDQIQCSIFYFLFGVVCFQMPFCKWTRMSKQNHMYAKVIHSLDRLSRAGKSRKHEVIGQLHKIGPSLGLKFHFKSDLLMISLLHKPVYKWLT